MLNVAGAEIGSAPSSRINRSGLSVRSLERKSSMSLRPPGRPTLAGPTGTAADAS